MNLVDMSFKVPSEFRIAFRSFASQNDISQKDLLIEAFELYSLKDNPSAFIDAAMKIANRRVDQINPGWRDKIIKSARKQKQKAYTYLMLDESTGLYKIGKSNTPKYRERTLQSEKPTIKLIAYCAGWVCSEKELHKKYHLKRVRGEWFDLSKSDVIYIKNAFNQ